jgi:hypothetical protein
MEDLATLEKAFADADVFGDNQVGDRTDPEYSI